MVIRSKTKFLFAGKALTEKQRKNSELNLAEIDAHETVLRSLPRRLVFELTNACNLRCVMCGRSAADFNPTFFNLDWLRYFESLLDTVEEVTLMGWGEPTMHPNFAEMLGVIDQYDARKYFCTNGMRLHLLKDVIFKTRVDVFAVSIDGAKPETNNRIRRGSDFTKIIHSIGEIIRIKKERRLSYPWINFVFTAMKSNLHELPNLVRLARDIGIDEVKVVYFTAFQESLAHETLYNCQREVREVFEEAIALGEQFGIQIKLPYIQGEDIAEDKEHKDCFTPWRDFFLGSDGYIRPCMSTPVQFERFDINKPFDAMWNSIHYQTYRQSVNNPVKMATACKRCYQSSFCNWNKKQTWLQMHEVFSPQWKG